MPLSVSKHPLVADSLRGLRDSTTPPEEFRTLARNVMTLLLYEATAASRDGAITITCERQPSGSLQFAIHHQAAPVLDANGDREASDPRPATNRLACEVVARAARALGATIEKLTLEDSRTEVRVILPARSVAARPTERHVQSSAQTVSSAEGS